MLRAARGGASREELRAGWFAFVVAEYHRVVRELAR
jgi:hypothetical protein